MHSANILCGWHFQFFKWRVQHKIMAIALLCSIFGIITLSFVCASFHPSNELVYLLTYITPQIEYTIKSLFFCDGIKVVSCHSHYILTHIKRILYAIVVGCVSRSLLYGYRKISVYILIIWNWQESDPCKLRRYNYADKIAHIAKYTKNECALYWSYRQRCISITMTHNC